MKKENFLERLPVVCILASFCCIMWGSASPSIKIGYELLHIEASDTPSIILFAGTRFLVAGILVVLLGSILQRKVLLPRKESLGPIVVLSLFQTTLQYIFFYVGLAHTTGVKGSIINGVNTFLTIIFAALLFRQEKLTARKVMGCLLGFVGVILINLNGTGIDMSVTLLGEGFILLTAAMSALSSGFIKIFSKKDNPVMLSGYQFMLGGVTLMIAGFATGGHVDFLASGASGIMVFIWLAIISAVAYTIWGVLIKHNPVSRVAIFGLVNPVSGAIMSSIFLGEKGSLTVNAWLAMLFVAVGIVIVNYVPQKREING